MKGEEVEEEEESLTKGVEEEEGATRVSRTVRRIVGAEGSRIR